MLPRYATQILLARQHRGVRPDRPVIVSFVGDTGFDGPHVFPDPGVEYDWRFLFDLPAIVAVKPGIDCLPALRGVFAEARLYPTLVDVELQSAASVIDSRLRLLPFPRNSPGWKELFA